MSINVSCQRQWLNVATWTQLKWIFKAFVMSYNSRSNSEAFTCKDYRAFADVMLPRLERVQHVPNEKLYKVKLL